MTTLIATLAVLAGLAWALTATASWISRKNAPRALGPGSGANQGPARITLAQEQRAMTRAQLRVLMPVIFAVVMFAALLRISIGLAGQAEQSVLSALAGLAALPIVLTSVLSASGGLLLYSALPVTHKNVLSPQRLLGKRSYFLGATVLLAFIVFSVAISLSAPSHLGWQTSIPLIVVALVFSGATILALRRLSSTASLPDPRMASLDLLWRKISAKLLCTFAYGVLLICFGFTAFLLGQSILKTSTTLAAQQDFMVPGISASVAGAALVVAGVGLLLLTAKGALHIRKAALANSATATA